MVYIKKNTMAGSAVIAKAGTPEQAQAVCDQLNSKAVDGTLYTWAVDGE